MDRDFHGELRDCEYNRSQGDTRKRKHEAIEAKESAVANIRERQLRWLRRGRQRGPGALAWRPKKVHRRAALRWLCNVDNQVFERGVGWGDLVTRDSPLQHTDYGLSQGPMVTPA